MAKQRRKLPARLQRKKRPRIQLGNVVNVPFTKRMYPVLLRFSGRNKLKVNIRYQRIQDGKVSSYTVDPYSIRYRRTREGVRKMLMGYHTGVPKGSYAPDRDGRIHNFAVRNIKEMTLQRRVFRPRWPVEFGV